MTIDGYDDPASSATPPAPPSDVEGTRWPRTAPVVTTPGEVLEAAIAALGATALHRRCSTELPGLPRPALAAAAGGTLPAALAGATSLHTLGSAIVTATLLLATAGFGRWPAAEACPPPSARSTRTGTAGDPDLSRQVLESVPLDVLVDEWHGIQVRSGSRSSDTALAELQVRALVVDEFSRRDPVGTTRWLPEGPDEPPEHYAGRPEDSRDEAPPGSAAGSGFRRRGLSFGHGHGHSPGAFLARRLRVPMRTPLLALHVWRCTSSSPHGPGPARSRDVRRGDRERERARC